MWRSSARINFYRYCCHVKAGHTCDTRQTKYTDYVADDVNNPNSTLVKMVEKHRSIFWLYHLLGY